MTRILAVLFVLLITTAGAWSQETRIAAVVNDDVISLGDLEARVKLVLLSSQLEDTPQARQRVTPEVMRTLIDETLELQEAKQYQLTVADGEVDESIDRLEKGNNMPKGGMQRILAANGIPISTLRQQIMASIVWGRIVQGRLARSAAVSDEEIDDMIARTKANIGKPESRVFEIFLSVDNPTQEDQVRQLADRLTQQIRGGASFPSVAQQFSQSPTAAVGGDLGWVMQGDLPDELDKAAQQLQPGQLSAPVRTTSGFYLLFLAERKVVGKASPDDAVVSLTHVAFPLAPDASETDRQHAVASAQQVSDAAKSCDDMVKLGKEYAPKSSGEAQDFTLRELPAEMRNTVQALKVGEVSKPLVLHDGVGVFMVCARKDAPPPIPTRDEIAEGLTRKHLDTLGQRYLRDLKREAYLDVRV